MNPPARKPLRTTLGFASAAVLACAACCAGPLLALVGGVGAASFLGAYWIPGLLAITAVAGIIVTVLLVRRARAKACQLPADRISVELLATRPAGDERPLSASGRPAP